MQTIRLTNRPADLAVLVSRLEELGVLWEWSDDDLSTVNLVLEELVLNAITHGGGGEGRHPISVRLTPEPGLVRVEVETGGPPFDLTQAPEPDLKAPVETREVGGLGLHLVRALTEELSYRRVGDENVVTLAIRVTSR